MAIERLSNEPDMREIARKINEIIDAMNASVDIWVGPDGSLQWRMSEEESAEA